MDDLNIYATPKTPAIKFNSNGMMEITGVSIPENSIDFYNPIVSWIKEYSKDPLPDSKLIFKLSYINTSSLQAIYDILVVLEGKGIVIDWYYLADDVDMKEIGEDFQSSVDVKISLIEVIAA